MRLIFFFSTVAFCLFAAMGLFAVIRGFSFSAHVSWATVSRKRTLELVFLPFSLLLALWALGSALFVSAGTAEEALFWFRFFAFSWFLAPGVLVVFAFALSGFELGVARILLPLLPGLLIVLANLAEPASVIASVTPSASGWHAVYAETPWSVLVLANTVFATAYGGFELGRTALLSAYKRRRAQAGIVLAFFIPTFLLSVFSGIILRWLGVTDLPPLTPCFLSLLGMGIAIAVFRYELLELTRSTAAERVFASVTDGVVLADTSGKVVDSNLAGIARGALLSDFVSVSSDAHAWLDLRAGESGEIEGKFAFKPGSYVPASIRVRAVDDGSGLVFGYVVAARDLAAEKSLERESALSRERAEALRSAEENFALVFRQCPAGMIISEIPTSKVLDANDTVCSFLGKDRGKLVGKNLWELGYSIDPDVLDLMRKTVERGDAVPTREVALRRRGFSPMTLAVAAVPIDFAGRKASLSAFVDISELSFLRGELYKARKVESIGVMAAGLAHDFNNILTAIMGNVSLARLSVEETGEVAEALSSAEAACARARDLSRQLLIFARGGVPAAQALDPFALVLETTRMALAGTSVTASFSSEPELPSVSADREQLSIAFNNLALNAAHSMPSGGTLKVRGSKKRVESAEDRAHAGGDYVCVEFTDEGAGIGPEYLETIFDPYMSSQRKSGGLNLAVCNSIIKRHGGWISVESAPKKGTTFSVYLPASRLPAEDASPPHDGKAERDLTMGKGSILLMDDEFSIRKTASRLLARLGYESTVVADGEAAIAAFKDARAAGRAFRSVILDLTVRGGMNGLDAASVIRSIDPSIPIYISSGYNDNPVLNDYPFYGFSGVIPKPYSLEELSARLAVVR